MIVISKRAYDFMTYEIDHSKYDETGGILLGMIDKKVQVLEAIDGGFNAIASPVMYEWDRAYLQHLVPRIANLYEPALEIVGVWHKHNHYQDTPFSSEDMELHEKMCNEKRTIIISILFQRVDNDQYMMEVYSVLRNGTYLAEEFEII